MRKIGIVAGKSEQTKKQPWWKFWKREDDYEEIFFEELDCSAVIVYVPHDDFEQFDSQILDFFRSCGVQYFCSTAETGAEELQRALIPFKLKYIARKFGVDTRNCRIILESNSPDSFMLTELAKICKSILIITSKTIEAARISDRIFTEFGLLIDVKREVPEDISEYDYLLKNNGGIINVEENQEYSFRISHEKIPPLPVKVNALRLIETLWKSGIISLEDIKL